MRIREIEFSDFRAFRGQRRVSFVDPIGARPRPLTILAGSNGSGKTTIFNVIEALLAFVLEPDQPAALLDEISETGLVCMSVELDPLDIGNGSDQRALVDLPEIMHIAVGRRDLAPAQPEQVWPNLFCRLVQRNVQGRPFVRKTPLAERLRRAVSQMHQGQHPLYGGYLYFPHDRQLRTSHGGPIEPPPEERPWRFRLAPNERWQGSLEQLWVWQNYLDLEQGNQKGERLASFVKTLESLLGEHRPITVREGRATVPAAWSRGSEKSVLLRLDQLPSGEQQCLLLFGELARRRREGAVIAIDEVENSLHPTLQRLVMWNLTRIAREWDAQVIVATHSWEIINSVRSDAFVNLDYPEDRFDLPVAAVAAGVDA
ncbi:MAG TPA: hypothetical protein DCL15_19770 [Chloroflexi bacterium]|nr:hypothetical protein [Chloroflexota bacterium]HHW86155.1 AAA family ATPase [Chloroflexota bacterium]